MGSNDFTCSECGHVEKESEIYKRYDSRDGKIEFKCSKCQELIGIKFHCVECDEWYGGWNTLKPYDNGSVCEYICPECDGIIRKGNVLDKKQGPYR